MKTIIVGHNENLSTLIATKLANECDVTILNKVKIEPDVPTVRLVNYVFNDQPVQLTKSKSKYHK